MSVFRLALLGACMSLLCAGLVMGAEDQAVSKEKKSGEGILVRATLGTEEYRVDGPIWLTVTMVNGSTKPVVYVDTRAVRDVLPKVTDLRKKAGVPLTLYGQEMAQAETIYRSVSKTLAPGEQITVNIDLARTFDLSLVSEYAVSCSLSYLDSEGKNQQSVKLDGLRFAVTDLGWAPPK